MGANAANGSHPVCQQGSPLQPQSTSSKKRTKSVVMIRVGVKWSKCVDSSGSSPDPTGELTAL